MIKLIINEIKKVKISKIIFTYILFIISLFIINKYSVNNIYDMSYYLIPFIGIIISILFSGSICLEIENGNMRYYLTKPYRRYKIYLSKLITIIIYILILYLLIVINTSFIARSLDYKYIFKYFVHLIPIIFLSSFILYLSIKLKSHVLVSTISILILCFSLTLSQVLFGIHFNIFEYTFLPYLDFSIFNDKLLINDMNNELGIHLSLRSGIIINIIYFILFSVLGIIKFSKKDIKS